MTEADAVVLLLVCLVMTPVTVLLWRYARGRVRRAEELQARGWICVGCNFLTGPIMVPGHSPRPDRSTRTDRARPDATG